MLDVNAKGVLTCTRAISKIMVAQEPRSVKTRNETRDIGRGSMVNVGSANSYAAIPGKVAYVTSKHAVMGITKTAGKSSGRVQCAMLIAWDCASMGVRVNAVCPSWVWIPMVEVECKKNPHLDGAIKALSSLGRPAEVEEVADVIVFLCSPMRVI